jgi:thioesterase domain-containing protein
VVVREDRPNHKQLVGYYVAAASGAVVPGALQAQLRQRLPRYMLPATLMELTALPLSPNGKVDRTALPRPATDRTARDAAAPPGDAIEASLVALWSDVLNCTGIGVDDNFFDLGGHSILAATMLLRAERALGRAPGLNVLFEGPTIRQLAHAFRGKASRPARMVLTWITDAASGEDRSRPPLIVMPSMFGAVDEWRTFFQGVDVDRPIFGLELLSDASYWTDQPTIEEIAARSVEVLLRDLAGRRFHMIGFSFGGRLAYEIGQQLDAAGRAPVSIMIVDTPTTGPRRSVRWRDLRSMLANVPVWMKNELQMYGAAALTRKIRNRWRFRVQAQGGVDGIFDVSQFPEGWRRRLFDSHRAFTAYRARPTSNRVVYLRSRVRSLIHSYRPDGGWGEHVPAPKLTVMPIPGDHGSVLYPRWRAEVGSAIQRALDQGDRY